MLGVSITSTSHLLATRRQPRGLAGMQGRTSPPRAPHRSCRRRGWAPGGGAAGPSVHRAKVTTVPVEEGMGELWTNDF